MNIKRGITIIFFVVMILLTGVAGSVALQTETTEDLTAGWRAHSNSDFGFTFKYPSTWMVDDNLKDKTCCLNLFNSINPYQGDSLRQDVMKAQFQYHIDHAISDREQYVDNLNKSIVESDMGLPIDKSTIVSIQNENGLEALKFSKGGGNVGYVVAINDNFSEVLYITVWNPDSVFERVLSTLNFTK